MKDGGIDFCLTEVQKKVNEWNRGVINRGELISVLDDAREALGGGLTPPLDAKRDFNICSGLSSEEDRALKAEKVLSAAAADAGMVLHQMAMELREERRKRERAEAGVKELLAGDTLSADQKALIQKGFEEEKFPTRFELRKTVERLEIENHNFEQRHHNLVATAVGITKLVDETLRVNSTERQFEGKKLGKNYTGSDGAVLMLVNAYRKLKGLGPHGE